MQYEVVHYKDGEWAAEFNDLNSGDCYRVLFIGPHANGRAQEYADWKNRNCGNPCAVDLDGLPLIHVDRIAQAAEQVERDR